ncbi:MocR-like pyridoxine biosynthesis transcription factor PdxR [Rhizobium sp. A37_96]
MEAIISRTIEGFDPNGLPLDAASDHPLHLQLYDGLRMMIVSGSVRGGTRIPSSRVLSQSLGVSRFTVITALDRLAAEGYIRAVRGSGIYVENVPGRVANKSSTNTDQGPTVSRWFQKLMSQRGSTLTWRQSRKPSNGSQLLDMATPDHRLFPTRIWTSITKEVFTDWDYRTLNYRELPVRSLLEEQIAQHLAVSRGIRCDPEEVVTTLGAHHAVALLAELLLDPGDTVAFEEPGMPAIRSIFESHSSKIEPMFVDGSGPNPSSVSRHNVKLAFVTAAKQQPMNVSMPLKRKLEMLNWASESGALIIEDDYASDFRYRGSPVPPLKALDQTGQVVHVGAFTSTLLLSLRAGYMILPKALANKCRELIQIRYRALPQLTEQTIARLIEDGHYGRHLHRVRKIYAKRQERFLSILKSDLSDVFELPEFAPGFYNLCYYKDQSIDEDEVLFQCEQSGLGVQQLSYYFANGRSPRKALMVGFAASNESEIELGLRLLKQSVLQSSAQRPK